MDGDTAGKTMDQGANSAINNSELSTGIHESNHQAVSPRNELNLSIISLMSCELVGSSG